MVVVSVVVVRVVVVIVVLSDEWSCSELLLLGFQTSSSDNLESTLMAGWWGWGVVGGGESQDVFITIVVGFKRAFV